MFIEIKLAGEEENKEVLTAFNISNIGTIVKPDDEYLLIDSLPIECASFQEAMRVYNLILKK